MVVESFRVLVFAVSLSSKPRDPCLLLPLGVVQEVKKSGSSIPDHAVQNFFGIFTKKGAVDGFYHEATTNSGLNTVRPAVNYLLDELRTLVTQLSFMGICITTPHLWISLPANALVCLISNLRRTIG